jgi:amino acid transporter
MTLQSSTQTEQAEAGTPSAKTALHRGSLSTAQVVFFIVAAAGPLAVTAGSLPVVYLVTGNRGLPFLFIPLVVVLAVFAVGYGAMSKHVADAGAFYTYVVRGLGRVAGVGAAFVAVVSYNALQMGVYGLFGVIAGGFFADKIGIELDWWWWCFFAWLIVGTLGVLRIDVNARILAVLLCLEVLVLAFYDFAVVVDPGPEGITLVGFDPSVATGAAFGAALIFCASSFVGFEGAAIYSEESKDPKRTVARATFIALAIIAVIYGVTSWLTAVAIGPGTITSADGLVKAGFTVAGAPDPTQVLIGSGTSRLGAFWGDSALLLLTTGIFAGLLSFHNLISRYFFALGREGVLPERFGHTNRYGAPDVGSISQSIVAFVIVGAFALAHKDPILTLFTWLASLGSMGVIFLMATASFAVFAFFRRQPDRDLGTWRTTVAPLVAGVALLAIAVLGLLNFNVLITNDLHAPTSDMTVTLLAILFGSGAIGLLVGAVLRWKAPERFAQVGEPTR